MRASKRSDAAGLRRLPLLVRQGIVPRSPLTVAVVLWFAMATFAASLSLADVSVSPGNRHSNPSGLTITIDTVGYGSVGYRPIFVRLGTTDKSAVTQDREFEVEFNARFMAGATTRLRTTIRLKSGSNQIESLIPMPVHGSNLAALTISVSERGTALDDLFVIQSDRGVQRDGTDWLWIRSDGFRLGDPRRGVTAAAALLAAGADASVAPQMASQLDLFRWRGEMVGEVLHPMDLFERWTDYSSFEGIIISGDQLSRLSRESPEQLQALMEWLRTGRTLIVDGTGDIDSLRQVVETSVAMPFQTSLPLQASPGEPSAEAKIGAHGFSGFRWYRLDQLDEVPTRVVRDISGSISPPGSELIRSISDSSNESRVACFGSATLILLDNEHPDADVQEVLQRVLAARGAFFSRSRRIGYRVLDYESRFGDWLIPGVGLPPVGTFRVLITLFVIVIGPINYFVLLRLRRLYLLMVTVPLGALLVCGALLGYSFVADGFQTKARVLSVSKLDQSTRESVSWSRQTYHSSVFGGQGYRFPLDCEVLPLVANGATNRIYDYEYEDGWLQLRRGNTGTRTTSQYLVTRSAQTEARLEIDATTASDGTLPFVNQLGSRIHLVGIVATNGELFLAESIPDTGSGSAKPVTKNDFVLALSQRIRVNTPSFPVGYYGSRPPSGRSGQQSTVASGFQEAGNMGDTILDVLSGDRLEPATFFAILEASSTIVFGARDVDERDSLHLVIGKY